MSSASAAFFKPDGDLIGFGIYFGTASVMEPQVCPTVEEAWEPHNQSRGGKRARWQRDESCEHHRRENCWVYSTYGAPDYWPGIVCMGCLSLLEGFSGFGPESGYYETLPEQWENWVLAAGGFPRDGLPPKCADPFEGDPGV